LYLNEDHSATTFRLLKALVPETVVFKGGADVSKDFAAKMQSRKYRMITSELHPQGAPRTHSYLSAPAYQMVQLMWRILKRHLCDHARPADKLVPFFLKFRDVVERLSHYAALDRLAACTEAW